MITSYQQTRQADVITVTATSDLSAPVWFAWYLDGLFMSFGRSASFSCRLGVDEQARIEAMDTNDPEFDPIAGAPEGFPARRTLWWIRSLNDDVDHYRVEEQKAGGAWQTLELVRAASDHWHYQAVSGRLDDLATYTWRIVPVDRLGNAGAVRTIGPELIVRTPDAPRYDVSFDPDATQVTFLAV